MLKAGLVSSAFFRKGAGDRMFVQIDPDENKMLIEALDSKCVYPVNPATGRIDESVEAMKRVSGIFSGRVHEPGVRPGRLGQLVLSGL